jgi:hypothetical protein
VGEAEGSENLVEEDVSARLEHVIPVVLLRSKKQQIELVVVVPMLRLRVKYALVVGH